MTTKDQLQIAKLYMENYDISDISNDDKFLQIIKGLVFAVNMAFDRSENDIFGTYHNDITDILMEAENVLKEYNIE
jgi:hypothetical protein